LYSVAAVHLDLVLVILPDNAKLNDTFGNGDDLEGGLIFGMLFEESAVFEGGDQLCALGILSALSEATDKERGWGGGGGCHTFVGLLEFGLRRKIGHD